MLRRLSLCAAALLGALIIVLNVSPAFALAASDIPVLGSLCRIFTFRQEQITDEKKVISITMPKLTSTGNSALEKRVNLEISRIIDTEVKDATDRANEYYDAFLSTGGKPEEYIPVEVTFNYEIKSITSQRVSFMIYKSETLANAYQTEHFYNLDLETGRDLTLRDLLGGSYRSIAAAQIERQLVERSPQLGFYLFDDVDIPALIDENRSFYLNENGKVVIVFDKYEIAAGAAGELEFVIDPDASARLPSVLKVNNSDELQSVLLDALRRHAQPPALDLSGWAPGVDPAAQAQQDFAAIVSYRPESCEGISFRAEVRSADHLLVCTFSWPD